MKTLKYVCSFFWIPAIMLEAAILWFYSIQKDGLNLWYCHKVAWSFDLSIVVLSCITISFFIGMWDMIKVFIYREN